MDPTAANLLGSSLSQARFGGFAVLSRSSWRSSHRVAQKRVTEYCGEPKCKPHFLGVVF